LLAAPPRISDFRHNYASVRWKSSLGFCVGGAFDLRMLAQVEKWMAIIREINRERPDRHRVDYVI
jgi:hypothetical protein